MGLAHTTVDMDTLAGERDRDKETNRGRDRESK